MPFAIAIRRARGANDRELFRHIAARSLRLILMSQILMSISSGKLHFQLINVLAQIGLTYFLCYLIMQLEFRWQAAYRGGAPDRPLGAVCGVPRHGRPIPLEDDQYRRGDR